MKPVRLLVALGASGVLLLGGSTVASAGVKVVAHMTATPNPAEVGDTVTVQNAPDGTCIGPTIPSADTEPVIVNYFIVNPDGSETEDFSVVPDVDGNWSATFEADMVGTYTVEAECFVNEVVVDLAPQAVADFFYEDLDIVVAQATTTTTAAPTTTTTAATAAVTATPHYTG